MLGRMAYWGILSQFANYSTTLQIICQYDFYNLPGIFPGFFVSVRSATPQRKLFAPCRRTGRRRRRPLQCSTRPTVGAGLDPPTQECVHVLSPGEALRHSKKERDTSLSLGTVEKVFFDSLTEGEKTPKRSKTRPSAYTGTVGLVLRTKSKCLATQAFQGVEDANLYEKLCIHGIAMDVLII